MTPARISSRLLISIHALLAESDAPPAPQGKSTIKFLSTLSLRRATQVFQRIAKPFRISIHALLAESDVIRKPTAARNDKFLSTLSLRRATVEEVSGDTWARDFYPRSPCGERRSECPHTRRHDAISIHALLAESDLTPARISSRLLISIHALLAESDGRNIS